MKNRSLAQRIGTIGEADFQALAARSGLIPGRFQEDYGLDFVCMVDLDPKAPGTSRMAGTFIGVSVRGTRRADRRVTLTRGDAEMLLRTGMPVCLVLAAAVSDTETRFYHRYNTEIEFAEQLT